MVATISNSTIFKKSGKNLYYGGKIHRKLFGRVNTIPYICGMEDITIIKGNAMLYSGCVYKATCIIDGTVYIGQTTNLKKRKSKHLKAGKYHNNVGYYDTFHTAIREHGESNFEWDIIEHIYSKDLYKLKNTLLERENFYIMEFSNKGKVYNREAKKQKVYKNILQYDRNGNFMEKWDYLIDIVEELNINRDSILRCLNNTQKKAGGFYWRLQVALDIPPKIPPIGKPIRRKQVIDVAAYDLDGTFIKSFCSLSEAAKYFKMPIVSVSKCVTGERKVSHGIRFVGNNGLSYPEKILPVDLDHPGTKSKPVEQYIYPDKFVARYESLTKASLETGVAVNTIRGFCNGRYNKKLAEKGFTFSWAE